MSWIKAMVKALGFTALGLLFGATLLLAGAFLGLLVCPGLGTVLLVEGIRAVEHYAAEVIGSVAAVAAVTVAILTVKVHRIEVGLTKAALAQ